MAILDYQTLMRPVFEVAAQQDEWPMRDLVEAVAPLVGVSAADRTEAISSGMGLWENRTQWAVTYLVKAGALRRPRRAVVQVTDRGRQLLTSGSAVDNKALEQFEEFRTFRTRVRPSPAAPATRQRTSRRTTCSNRHARTPRASSCRSCSTGSARCPRSTSNE